MLLIHLTIGSKGAYPYGVAVGLSVMEITFWALLAQYLQIPVFFFILEEGAQRVRLLAFMRERFIRHIDTLEQKRFLRWFLKKKLLGVFLVSVIPNAGGNMTGSALCYLLKIPMRKAFIPLAIGVTINTFIFAGGTEWLLRVFNLK